MITPQIDGGHTIESDKKIKRMARKFYRENNEQIPAIVYELSQPVGFTEITDEVELKRLYINLYQQRKVDGLDYFDSFRADLMMDIINQRYTSQQVFDLENHLSVLISEIVLGNWLTAQNENFNLIISGIYDQTMKDEIQTTLDNYVNDNY